VGKCRLKRDKVQDNEDSGDTEVDAEGLKSPRDPSLDASFSSIAVVLEILERPYWSGEFAASPALRDTASGPPDRRRCLLNYRKPGYSDDSATTLRRHRELGRNRSSQRPSDGQRQ
jgi:hypothetical protein